MRTRDAAHNRKLSPSKRPGYAAFTIHPTGGEAFTVHLSGRLRWALTCPVAAGASGCTPILQPAPRWSGYIHQLRQLGVEIETLTEPHGGDYPGRHGRYVLRCQVVQEGGGK